jgi:hypothetical protein
MTTTILTKDEASFYAEQLFTYIAIGTDEAEAHRTAAIDTATRYRTEVERYAALAPVVSDEITVGDAVMVTLDDAPAPLAATVVGIEGSRYDCRLTRNRMIVSIWRASKIRKA